MTQSACASWGALEAPWRAAIEMAWQSYRDGGIAVGAVLADAAGAVLGEGRNRRFADRARGLLAHAEMEALAALPPEHNTPAPASAVITDAALRLPMKMSAGAGCSARRAVAVRARPPSHPDAEQVRAKLSSL